MLTTTLYSRVFRGAPDQISRVRKEVRDHLKGCPVTEETVLIASELAANAVTHSASRDCVFTVRAELHAGYAWIEVEDLGGPWHPRQRDGRPHGLDILAALVGDDWGVETTTDGGRVVWARVDHG
jgi:anti-sigma regulatory factor (Ser/Thr protein kinase)